MVIINTATPPPYGVFWYKVLYIPKNYNLVTDDSDSGSQCTVD